MEQFICPGCKRPLVLKTANNNNFFGCTGFPACKAQFPVDADGGPDTDKSTYKIKTSVRRTPYKSQIER